MARTRAWAAWGSLLLIATVALGVLSAQEPAKPAPKARPKGVLGQFTSREQWQLPVRVMDEIGVRSGMTVADVGAGDGWFTFYLAERVGTSGRVIAEDIDAEALKVVRARCAREKVSNVSVLVGRTEDPMLPAGTVDLALMVNVLSALGDARSFLGNLAKSLKPQGRLVVVDWNPVKVNPEIPERDSTSALRQTLRQLEDAGFELERALDFLPAQTIWVCRRRGVDR